ncbi:MAG TPA: glycosyltransferase family 9 protein [Gemmatimonadaceae bacterium]|jgi:ADP-heptose:LPS heptosyltransferase|nr:glycosyltransferase family 9 protein [Gemmatimonadaceae bacterium]
MANTRAIRRILLVALDNLGDLVFASALAEPLHAAFPDAVIGVWSKAYTAAVARLIPHVHEVVAADPFWAVAPHLTRPPIVPMLKSIATVHHGGYDVAVVSEAPWRTAAAVALTRIPMRIGLSRRRNGRFLTHVLPAEDEHQPVLREQARLLAPLGVQSEAPVYRLEASRLGGLRDRMAAWLPRRFVALHPFASVRNRCVPLSEWTQLAFAFHGRGLPTLWVGTPSELDELRGSYMHPRGFYVDDFAESSLAATAAALSLAALFVGHDSGPLHVAGAFGVPVIGVFAPGQPKRTFPQGPGPWRMIARPTPDGITASVMLREADALGVFSTA